MLVPYTPTNSNHVQNTYKQNKFKTQNDKKTKNKNTQDDEDHGRSESILVIGCFIPKENNLNLSYENVIKIEIYLDGSFLLFQCLPNCPSRYVFTISDAAYQNVVIIDNIMTKITRTLTIIKQIF